MTLDMLKRVRWAVRATLLLGVAASVVANVLHAIDNPIAQSIAAWPPLALLLTVELISRIPVHNSWLGAARMVATAVIAGIAAWVSYWHMVGVALRYGETDSAAHLIPLSVDGLIVVASICLVELGGQIRTEETPPATAESSDQLVIITDDFEPVPDPWRLATPIVPEPVKPKRVQPRSLTAADRVKAAHEKNPDATHERIAKLAGVSVSTVKRHRPAGSPSDPTPAETPINGKTPDLEEVAL